jgi:tellurite resistance-related uncharacterized protein
MALSSPDSRRDLVTAQHLPGGLELQRTTPTFDETSTPLGLRAAHAVADGVWGRLIVESGSLGFVFEDTPGDVRIVAAGEHQLIPPARLHHVVIDGPVRFAVEFHR